MLAELSTLNSAAAAPAAPNVVAKLTNVTIKQGKLVRVSEIQRFMKSSSKVLAERKRVASGHGNVCGLGLN